MLDASYVLSYPGLWLLPNTVPLILDWKCLWSAEAVRGKVGSARPESLEYRSVLTQQHAQQCGGEAVPRPEPPVSSLPRLPLVPTFLHRLCGPPTA